MVFLRALQTQSLASSTTMRWAQNWVKLESLLQRAILFHYLLLMLPVCLAKSQRGRSFHELPQPSNNFLPTCNHTAPKLRRANAAAAAARAFLYFLSKHRPGSYRHGAILVGTEGLQCCWGESAMRSCLCKARRQGDNYPGCHRLCHNSHG